MSWGYKILFAYVGFVGIMLGMVFVASKQSNDMIDENYYDKELKFQSQIDAQQNLLTLDQPLLVKVQDAGVVLDLPDAASANIQDGKIEFLCNSDKNRDVIVALKTDAQGLQKVDRSRFKTGTYKMRMRWNSDGESYYHEETISIP